MKEQIKQIIAETPDRLRARSLVREYLHARILQFLQESSLFRTWIFHGGTALRFLYMLPRYSEDLDFALERTDASLDFSVSISNVRRWFESEAYRVETNINERRVVKSAFILFPGLLYELDLSSHQSEALSIKIELDSKPPTGGVVETSIVRRYVVLHVLHYDKASLLSGKLHAILDRPYVKGRDLFDIYWYLSNPAWPVPNIKFLNEALSQTHWKGPEITEDNWALVTEERLASVDWRKAVEDVRPFIERIADLRMMTKENVLKLLKTKDSTLHSR